MHKEDLPTVQMDTNSARQELDERVCALKDLIPELEEAKKRYEELNERRYRLELDIQEYRRFLEDALMEDGEWHDQLAQDFSLDTHGHNKRMLSEPLHGQMYIECACEVQCPVCKRYNISVKYWRQRYGERAIYRQEQETGTVIDGYMVCSSCSEPKIIKKKKR